MSMIPTTDLQQKLFSNKCKLIKLGGEPINLNQHPNIYCQCKQFQSSEGKTNMHDFQGQMKRPKMGSK